MAYIYYQILLRYTHQEIIKFTQPLFSCMFLLCIDDFFIFWCSQWISCTLLSVTLQQVQKWFLRLQWSFYKRHNYFFAKIWSTISTFVLFNWLDITTKLEICKVKWKRFSNTSSWLKLNKRERERERDKKERKREGQEREKKDR